MKQAVVFVIAWFVGMSMAASAQEPPQVREKAKQASLPTLPAPRQVLAQVAKAGGILVTFSNTAYVAKASTPPGGGPISYYYEPTSSMFFEHIPSEELKAYDVRGNPITPKRLSKLLRDEIPVLMSSDGNPVDGLHLRLFKDDVIVLVRDRRKQDASPGFPFVVPVAEKPRIEPVPLNPPAQLEIPWAPVAAPEVIGLKLSVDAPKEERLGSLAECKITVTNFGKVKAVNVLVAVQLSDKVRMANGFDFSELNQSLADLDPGQKHVVDLKLKASEAGRHSLVFTASAAGFAAAKEAIMISFVDPPKDEAAAPIPAPRPRIVPIPEKPKANPKKAIPDFVPEKSSVRISIEGPESPIVGSEAACKITLTNDGQFSARKVFVLVGFPKGVSIQLPPDSAPNVVEMKRLILEFDRPFMDLTVTELKADQKVVFGVLVRASEKGGHRLGCMTCAHGFAATDAGIEITFVDPPKDKAEPKKKQDPAFEKVIDDPKLPRVLIIGDSISIGYTLGTRKLLAGKANVHRIPENAADTKTGVAKLSKWLGDSKWDAIHFNWGLHDLKLGTGSHQVSPLDYDKNLREIVTRLKATKAKLIWASTTAVPDAKLNPPRSNDDVTAYNLAASKIMKEHGIAINDLYGFVQPRLKELQLNANVHFTPVGSSALAERVAAAIRSALDIK